MIDVCCWRLLWLLVVLDTLLEQHNSLSADVPHSGRLLTYAAAPGGDSGLPVMRDDDDKQLSMDCTDVFYDSDLFPCSDRDDADLFNDLGVSADLGLLSDPEPLMKPNIDFFADCDQLMHDGNGELVHPADEEMLEKQTLQLLSEAGIQQPAQRQIRLHSELAHHLSTSPTDDSLLARSDSMLVGPQTESSSESELVKMLTSALEDTSSMAQLLPLRQQQQQHVPMVTVTSANLLACSADLSADSELVRQLSSDDVHDANSAVRNQHQQQQQQQHAHQRVALVQPTVARPFQTADVKTSQLIVNHQPHSVTQLRATQPQSALSVHAIHQTPTQPAPTQIVITTQAPVQTQHETTQAVPRQIVITTQAPVQTQHVPQISLQQLQQVMPTFSFIHIAFSELPSNSRLQLFTI